MVQVLRARAGPASLILTLRKWGVEVTEAAGPSVGTDNFNVSDGAGGWRGSLLSESTPGITLLSEYAFVNFVTSNTFTVMRGTQVVQRLNAVTSGSWAANRLCAVDSLGTSNTYLDPQRALYEIVVAGLDVQLTPAQVNLRHITVNCSVGGITITLPDPAGVVAGARLSVKDLNGNATASPITIVADGGTNIDGAASASIAADYLSLTFQCDGTLWFSVA